MSNDNDKLATGNPESKKKQEKKKMFKLVFVAKERKTKKKISSHFSFTRNVWHIKREVLHYECKYQLTWFIGPNWRQLFFILCSLFFFKCAIPSFVRKILECPRHWNPKQRVSNKVNKVVNHIIHFLCFSVVFFSILHCKRKS